MSPTATVEAPTVEVDGNIVADAAKALDDRKSKLAFAKQVLKSRAQGVSDADFATALVGARVALAYGEGANVDQYAKDFQMSAAKVGNYGTTLAQLQEAKAPITENTFGDWFKMTTTGGSATPRKDLIETLLADENADLDQAGKANVIRATREAFFNDRKVKDPGNRAVTIDGIIKMLEKASAQKWDETDRDAIQTILFDAGAAIADGQTYVYVAPAVDEVEAEQVAA